MSEAFAVGELALIVYAPGRERLLGVEVEIVGPLEERIGLDNSGRVCRMVAYAIATPDGERWNAMPQCLRKIPPLADPRQVADWQDVPWRPQVTA